MKKLTALLAAAALIITLTGCGGNSAEVGVTVADTGSVAAPTTDTIAEGSKPADKPASTTAVGTTAGKAPASTIGATEAKAVMGTDESEPITNKIETAAVTAAATVAETAAAKDTTEKKPASTTAAKPAEKPALTTVAARSEAAAVAEEDYSYDDDSYDCEDEGYFEPTAGVMADAVYAEGGVFDDGCIIIDEPSMFDPYEEIPSPTYDDVQATAGLLTAGEWNDNDNWDFWGNIYQTHDEWSDYRDMWAIRGTRRLAVNVTAKGAPAENAKVALSGGMTAITDNNGDAYLFFNPTDIAAEADVTVTLGADTQTVKADTSKNNTLSVAFEAEAVKPTTLDLMFVFDTTGSMGDELVYLQEEMKDVIRTVKKQNDNLPVKLSVNFYRDVEDEYTVLPYDFTDDIDEACKVLSKQYASGGGDYEEAVEMALDDAVNNHSWSSDSTKLLFIVLDAPPHSTTDIAAKLNKVMTDAAAKGIRIIPVASSGVDKNTEFLLRTLAYTTGGTYTFLTDDSGIGGGHIEPTIGDYTVEKLNEMIIRIIGSYLK